MPHVTVTWRSKHNRDNRRATRIAAYKEDVRKSAMIAGAHIPATPSKMKPVVISTRAYFRNERHGDPESVHKVIKDALWPARQGGDKYTGGSYDPPLYDAKNPRVEVEVRF